MTAGKIAWIIGSGFSRPLGLPLLDQLLTEESARRLCDVYDLEATTAEAITAHERNSGLDPLAVRIARLMQAGKETKQWQDAEGFLEALDDLGELHAERAFRAWVSRKANHCEGVDTKRLRTTAFHLLAAEVSLPLKGYTVDRERMAPYVAWARDLQPDDVVISFNYDRAVEIASQGTVAVPTPDTLPEVKARQAAAAKRAPLLLKLHGSVDWTVVSDQNNVIVPASDPEHAVTAPLESIALATPGRSKRDMAHAGKFKALWDEAGVALRNASVVVFVGYRMPPSDAYAKQFIIQELRKNAEQRRAAAKTANATKSIGGPISPNRLVVYTVLGPTTGNVHSERLRGLLAQVDPDIIQWSPCDMGSEDFLGLVTRDQLLK